MSCLATFIGVCHNAPVFHVGDVVKKLRAERNWTIEDLSQRAEVNKATVSALERGEANFREDTLSKIAAALGTTTAELYAATVLQPPGGRSLNAPPTASDVEDDLVDVSGYTPHDIPVVAEGEATPNGSLFWTDEGVLKSDVEDRISRPRDVTDPKAYGVKVRGDSMLPVFRPGMTLIVSPNLPVHDGDEVYVQLLTGERLIKIARRVAGGWLLESTNPVYEPRFVKKSEIGAMHTVIYARRRRQPSVNDPAGH